MIKTICVAGAGTMGSGIALACAMANFRVILFDVNAEMLLKAGAEVHKNLSYLLNKEKITIQNFEQVSQSIRYVNEVQQCKADLVIEAIVEKIEVKQELLSALAQINSPPCILASNTSSLSISVLQEKIADPQRVAGLHFFNPAQVMKLVEVVEGNETSKEVIQQLLDFCRQINKVPVHCKDAPGFIVNRVARHFYLRSLQLAENGAATPGDIDAAMEAAGFKMGPFKLMDLIGMDINYAVSESLYQAFHGAERFTPSVLQKQKLLLGELGRKTGKGFYDYSSTSTTQS